MTLLAAYSFALPDSSDLGALFDPNGADASNLGLRILSNAAQTPAAAAGSDGSESYNGITFPLDYYTEVTYGATSAAGAGAGVGPTVRMINGTLTFYRAIGNASGYGLSSAVAGSFASLSTGASPTFTAGDRLGLGIRGSTWSLWKNGVQFATSTDSAISAANRGGIGYSSTDTGTTASSWLTNDWITAFRPRGGSMHPGRSPGKSPQSGRFTQIPRANNASAASPDVTVALTGVSATGDVGTVGVQHDQPITGNAGTSAVGSVTPNTTVALTGVAGTSAVGSVTPSTSVALTGVTGTGAAGTVAPSTSVALTGVAGTGAAGTVTPNTTVALTGVAGTSAVGTVAPSTTIGLTGVSATGAVGTVTPSGGDGGNVTVALTGVSATGSVGSVTPSTTVALTGVAGASAVGSVTPSAAVALTGVAGTAAVGSVTPSTTVALTGVAGTSAVGSVSVLASGDVTVALTGVGATASVGSVTASGGDVTTSPQFGTGGGGGHKGSSPEEIRRRRRLDEELERELRALYRKIALGKETDLAERVEKIVAPLVQVKKPPAKRTDRIELRARALQLQKLSIDTQIALRLAEKEYEDRMVDEENMRRISLILQLI